MSEARCETIEWTDAHYFLYRYDSVLLAVEVSRNIVWGHIIEGVSQGVTVGGPRAIVTSGVSWASVWQHRVVDNGGITEAWHTNKTSNTQMNFIWNKKLSFISFSVLVYDRHDL